MAFVAQSTPQDLLASGKTVVVPSDTVAQQFRHLHDNTQRSRGLNAWTPANVLTWDQWLRSLWAEFITNGQEDRLLLNATQEHRVWRDIVQAHSANSESLSSVDSLASLAAHAWQMSEGYGATARLRQAAVTHDARVFAEWAEAFSLRCQHARYVSRASLETVIAARALRSPHAFTKPHVFAGFLDFLPSQVKLLGVLRNVGADLSQVQVVAPSSDLTSPIVLRAEAEELELQAVARWIRAFMESRILRGSSARVGVLVPDLATEQDALRSAFVAVLAPELQSVTQPNGLEPFEFLRSGTLLAEPMIAVALDLARWSAGPLGRSTVSALLLSPYLASEAAQEQAAQFDACTLRTARLLRSEVDLRWIVKELRRKNAANAIAWPLALTRFLEKADPPGSLRSFAQWTEFIRRLVRICGWPGERPLSAQEEAVLRAWDHVLDSVAALDFAGVTVTFHDALHALEHELARTSSRKSSGRALVQIMQPSEAEGLTFDAVIFMRATDSNWPPSVSSTPLIPWSLQAELGMPGADRAAATLATHDATTRLLASSPTVVFSFSATNDEGPQRLSPLISELDFPIQQAGTLAPVDSDMDRVEAELIEDTSPLPELPSRAVHGGATILQHQAACGFRAFAEIRLRAQELEGKDLGYDARERGNLLHTVMQRFWSEVKTQSSLKAMTSTERHTLLESCVDQALSKSTFEQDSWSAAYLRLQKERFVRLLSAWLSAELKRGDFEVLSTELKQHLALGPLDLTIRVDRIDRVDGGVVLVDYKTGSAASTENWEGERPDEPQLPLYSLLAPESELSGISFAKIRPGKTMGWQGYGTTPDILPGRDTSRDLSALQREWRGSLTALAEAFATGDVSVQPKTYPGTCSFCSQRLLCRLDTTALLDTDDPDELDEEESV